MEPGITNPKAVESLLVKEDDITEIYFTSRGNQFKLFLSNDFFERLNKHDNKTKLTKLKAALEAIS